MLRHIVVMKFRSDADEKRIAEVQEGLGRLPDRIPEIDSYEFGRDIGRSDRSYDFSLVSSFADMDALRTYMMHPEHQKVVGILKEICEDIRAVDYEY